MTTRCREVNGFHCSPVADKFRVPAISSVAAAMMGWPCFSTAWLQCRRHRRAGPFDHKIVTTLCPGGKERMRRLMAVIAARRVDLAAMVTHRFKLDDIEAAYELFSHQRDGVLKVAITP